MLSFTPAGNYDTAPNLSAIVAADFNNDGKLDLASAGGFSATRVDVRLGDGAGGFGAAQVYAYGNWGYPSSIAAADFDNDDSLDIVVTDSVGFAILMNNGDGTFQSAVVTGADFAQVAVGHFNNDNSIDLVVGWYHWEFGLHYQPYLGNGQGGFAAGLANQIGSANWGNDRLAAVELNNDGKLDVVIGDGRVLLGNGNGTFQYDYGQPVPLSSGAIATGDFTGDGNADVIVTGNSIKVLRSRGDGGFDAPIQHLINGHHGAVATADFNGDEKLDAAVINGDTGTVSLMLGNGDGTLRYAGAFATGTLPSGIAAGDFNGDGRTDVAVANGVDTISVLLNDGVWQAEPNLIGDYNLDQRVNAVDYVMWRKMLGTTVTPSTGADGNGNGVVDQDDYSKWREHFAQTSPPSAASNATSAAAESNLSGPQVRDAKLAVELRGASENQRAKMTRETAFIELLARRSIGRAEYRPALPLSQGSRATNHGSECKNVLLMGRSQSDLKHEPGEWNGGHVFDSEAANDAGDSLLDSLDNVFALLTSD